MVASSTEYRVLIGSCVKPVASTYRRKFRKIPRRLLHIVIQTANAKWFSKRRHPTRFNVKIEVACHPVNFARKSEIVRKINEEVLRERSEEKISDEKYSRSFPFIHVSRRFYLFSHDSLLQPRCNIQLDYTRAELFPLKDDRDAASPDDKTR